MNVLIDTTVSIGGESRQLNEPLHCACVPLDDGALLVACSSTGLVLAELVDAPLSDDALLGHVQQQFPACQAHLAELTIDDIRSLPLHLVGSAFQCRVWRALLAIPAGHVCHYQDIARQIGSGARAVGSAVAHNRIALRVPCHRVVPRAGGSGQYRWGAQRKARLLEAEAAHRAA